MSLHLQPSVFASWHGTRDQYLSAQPVTLRNRGGLVSIRGCLQASVVKRRESFKGAHDKRDKVCCNQDPTKMSKKQSYVKI